MNKRLIIAEIVQVANSLDDSGMFVEADKLTNIANRLAIYDMPVDPDADLGTEEFGGYVPDFEEEDALGGKPMLDDRPIQDFQPDVELEFDPYNRTMPADNLFKNDEEYFDGDGLGDDELDPELMQMTASVRLKKKIRY